MSSKSGKKLTKQEELLLQDFSRNVSTKSSALFYGNAVIVSIIPICKWHMLFFLPRQRPLCNFREGWIRWAELIGWADPLTVVNGWSNMADPTSETGGWSISLSGWSTALPHNSWCGWSTTHIELGGWSTPVLHLIWLIYYLNQKMVADLLPTSY